ncbi:MAG: hypothetical protein AABX24_06245 [Nanoarchaeota archaeon]
MVKVEIFTTIKEADQKLKIHYSKNRGILTNMLTEIQARRDVYGQSAKFHKLHPEGKNSQLTLQEMQLLCKDLGKGEVLTYLVKLYACGLKPYNFDYGIYDPNDLVPDLPQDSLEALAEKVHLLLKEDNQSIMGVKATPLFYTVRELYTFSVQEKITARELLNYQSLSSEEKFRINKHLDSYVERSLTTEEIKDFTLGYARFLN